MSDEARSESCVYSHNLSGAYRLDVFSLSPDVFVILCWDGARYGKKAAVEHCLRCAWATCHRLEGTGKWEELAPEDESDLH